MNPEGLGEVSYERLLICRPGWTWVIFFGLFARNDRGSMAVGQLVTELVRAKQAEL